MKRILKALAVTLAALLILVAAGAAWYIHSKQPQRSGSLSLTALTAPVSVRYDERGVPHIRAENEADLYRALGYVQAQDRLFQMEMTRRLANGELAEILGPTLLEVDKFFRTLGLKNHADSYVAAMDKNSPNYRCLDAYLDGINQFQASHPAPIEFDVLGIPKRPFTPADTMAVVGYTAYSFAAAIKTDPTLTFVRDKLGADHLKLFDLDWHPQGVLKPTATPVTALSNADWRGLGQLAQLSRQATQELGVPAFEGSNAWAIAGQRTVSGKAMLSGDPHIGFSVPAVWYEAQLSAPGMELYGNFLTLTPSALLGHNLQFAWSLTMFENDDLDFIAEKRNPDNANQVWYHGHWVELQQRVETIAVKGAAPVKLVVQRSPHGPIVNSALGESAGKTPIAMWWAFLETENPALQGFYELNRADTLIKARTAASKIHAPGLNIVWANASGDIGWWAAARLPIRPAGVNPNFILDGSSAESDKNGYTPFSENPHEENPARGYIMSANHQPLAINGVPVPGYYCIWDRAQELEDALSVPGVKWDTARSQALQLDVHSGYSARVIKPLLPVLREVVTDPGERALLEKLAAWDGQETVDSSMPTLFHQMLYELAVAALSDKMGAAQFKNLLQARALDFALPRLAADESSPWWSNAKTPGRENRAATVKTMWRATLAHLQKTFGPDPAGWTWGKAHTLTHSHPLGMQKPLDKLFNVGPFAAPGGRELPNNLGGDIGPAPWAVSMGPSTRRVIDFGDASKAVGINPVGQSGVLFDAHYSDQAADYIQGKYKPLHLSEADVAASTRSTLKLEPARP
jgi:penicillin amidase